MAPLTWRNVAAPDFSPAAQMLNSVAQNWGDAASNIGGALSGLGQIQRRNRSAAALPILARVADEGGVDAALSQVEGMVAPHNRSPELLAAIANLRGASLGYERDRALTDGTRANTASTLGQESRAGENHRINRARDEALGGLTNDLVQGRMDAYSGNDPFGGLAPASLAATESGGSFSARNDAVGSSGRRGHFGRVQMGHDRLDEAKAAGVIPSDMTPEQYLADEEAQRRAEEWHFGDIHDFIDENGLDQYVGEDFGGIPITRDGMIAVANLGGKTGLRRFLETGGLYDPADANGTRLSAYARTHAGNTTEAAAAARRRGAIQGARPRPQIDYSAGGILRPGDVLPLIDDTYTAYDTGQRDRDDNRNRDFAFDVAATDRQRAEETRLLNQQADAYLDQNRRTFTRGLDDAVNRIMNDESITDPRMRDAIISRIRQDFENNPEYYNVGTPTSGPLATVNKELRRAVGTAETDLKIEGLLDPGPLGGSSDGRGGGDSGASGERFTSGDRLPDAVVAELKSLEDAGVDVSSATIIDNLNRAMDETGYSKDVILRAMSNSLRGSRLNMFDVFDLFKDGAVLDVPRFKAMVAELAPGEVRRAENERRLREEARVEIALYQQEFADLQREYALNERNKPAGWQARNEELLARMQQIPSLVAEKNAEIADALRKATEGFGEPDGGNGSPDTAGPAPRAQIGPGPERASAALEAAVQGPPPPPQGFGGFWGNVDGTLPGNSVMFQPPPRDGRPYRIQQVDDFRFGR